MVDTKTYLAAARAFSALVDSLPKAGWDGPGLGVWDVRALTGHASRALVTVSTYLQQPAADEAVASPVEYYLVTTAATTTDPDAVAERGRRAGAALGDDPAGAVRSLVADVTRDLQRANDPLIETIVGGMRLSAYLPTRIFELAVHSLDIAEASGTPFALPDEVLAEALALAVRIAATRGDGSHVLMALTGRRPLRDGFSVV